MKRLNRLHLLLAAVILVTFTWFIWSRLTTAGKSVSRNFAEEQVQQKKPKDPCWFMSLKDETIPLDLIEKRQAREMYGYPSATPLSEAINIFNEEMKCKALYAEYPPLTDDELIAAIVAGADYGKQGEIWLAQKDTLWRIASERTMPKGSLLVVESGGRVQESPLRPDGTIQAKGIRITLILGLDRNVDDKGVAKPEQTLVIRKTYSQVEIVR
jgi:hypothetical protein